MMGFGRRAKCTAKVRKRGQMVRHTSEITKLVEKKDKESILKLMEQSRLGSGRMTYSLIEGKVVSQITELK